MISCTAFCSARRQECCRREQARCHARAFFYAGARALLVTHWAVASQAATRIAIGTFEHLTTNPTQSRAEALRQAMLDFMQDRSNPANAYPALWGPFAIIGDARGRQ